jgi:hypothetical protein
MYLFALGIFTRSFFFNVETQILQKNDCVASNRLINLHLQKKIAKPPTAGSIGAHVLNFHPDAVIQESDRLVKQRTQLVSNWSQRVLWVSLPVRTAQV